MHFLEKVSLSQYSTMGLGGQAAYLVEVTDKSQLKEAAIWARSKNLPSIVIGSGSNIVWQDQGYPGLVIVNNILGYETTPASDSFTLEIGAGEVWDHVVEQAVSDGLSGIECLSLIPGKAGATPVQNVGAYGQEISQSLISLEALDSEVMEFVTIENKDCAFGYRTSRFKASDQGRFYICSIKLRLKRTNLKPPFYASLDSYLVKHKVSKITPETIRHAVINIRNARLPDPAKVKNNGSFFANPIVSRLQLDELIAKHGELPHWRVNEDEVKLSAAWLIEKSGFRDFHDKKTGMGTWPAQPLVLVNENAATTADLLAFKQKIVSTVENKFAVSLIQEPELLP